MKNVLQGFLMLTSLTIGLTLVLGAPIPKKKEPKELQLDGTWKLTTIEGIEKPMHGSDTFFVFDKNIFYSVCADSSPSSDYEFSIDYKKTPFQFDACILVTLRSTGKKVPSRTSHQLGIIEVEGDTMKLRLGEPGSSERPMSFRGTKDAPLYIFKREKSAVKK
ncbi:MAG: hypothetical protein R3B84_12440 [Zavarzinella sp.]